MPTLTPDQGLSLPDGPDVAYNPTAFQNFVAGVEQRLVRLYADAATRTLNRAVVAENELSGLGTENRIEVYDGSNDISLYTRALYTSVRKAAAQVLTASSTVLQNVTSLVSPLSGGSGSIYRWRSTIYYDASTTADIKFAYTIPAGATMRWSLNAIGTGGTNPTLVTVTASGTATAAGGLGVGTVTPAYLEGEVTLAGTTGNLQLQSAQNTGDASVTTIFERSFMEVWRMS